MNLFGREVIYTSKQEINEGNVLDVLAESYTTHLKNYGQIDYLYKYYKGKQPILFRTKEVRPEINNKVVENRANEIVSFKTGYIVGEPIQYICRNENSMISDQIATLNSMMISESKATQDKELFDWMHICGTGYRLVVAGKVDEFNEAPFRMYTLDPRNTFVIYSNEVDHRPLAGVYVTKDKHDGIEESRFTVYTATQIFEIVGWNKGKIESVTNHILRNVPIVEYPLNAARLGSFETVVDILDAINNVDSNRLDGIEQFIQSLAVAVNCQFDDDVTANDIRQAGMIVLSSVGENKADFKILSEQLNQSETQTLKNDMYNAVLQICGMPSQGDGSSSDSSNNGAVILRNGWQSAEARAKDSELMFKKSERQTLKIVLRIVNSLSKMNIRLSDIDCKFTRRNYEDILSKSQTLVTMLGNDKIHPRSAYTACGLFIDTEEAYKMGMSWYEQQQAKATKLLEQEKEIETDSADKEETESE